MIFLMVSCPPDCTGNASKAEIMNMLSISMSGAGLWCSKVLYELLSNERKKSLAWMGFFFLKDIFLL